MNANGVSARGRQQYRETVVDETCMSPEGRNVILLLHIPLRPIP